MARFITATGTGGSFGTSTKYTGLNQRHTLEAIMLNLATHLGIETISKQTSARGAEFYRPDGVHAFQSATNTIYELSLMLEGVESDEVG